MEIAASLRLLRRMHSPSCTYSPRRRDSTNFLVLKEGAHVSPSQSIIIGLIRNGRGDPVWVRGALCTELEYGVRTVYSAQCIVLSIIVTDTALPPPEVSGLEKRATRPHKEKKKDRHFLSTVWCVSTRGLFTYFDAPVILQEWHVCWSTAPGGQSSENCHAQTPEKYYCLISCPTPSFLFSCTDLSRCFPKGGSYSALCYHSCHQRVNRSSCRIRNKSDAELWLERGLQLVLCVRAPIPAKIMEVGAVCGMQWWNGWYRIIDYVLFRQRRHPFIHSVQFVALIDKWLFRTVPSRQSRKIRS